MLTYTPKPSSSESTREYPWLLMLLVFAWLWPGVFSHDLWNPHEPRIFAIIEATPPFHFPSLLGESYFQVAPIYIGLASCLKSLFAPWLMDNYAAARFASVIFTAVGLISSGMAAYRLLGQSHGRSAVLILIGSAGLLNMGHFLNDMSVAFAGVGLSLWGLAIANKQAGLASLLLSMGTLLLAQTMGWLVAGGVLLSMLLLCNSRIWRSKRFILVILGMLSITLPLGITEPLVMMKMQPKDWQTYWLYHIFGDFGGMAGIQAAFHLPYYLKNMLWFAFPAYPLAIWALYRLRHQLNEHRVTVLCLTWCAVFGALLAVYPTTFQDNLILLLPPLSILGAAQLDHLRRGVAAFLNWFGIMVFGLVSIFLWVGFVAMNYGFPAKLAERAAYFSPYYTRDIDIMPMIVAISFTPIWLFAITRKRIRGRQAVSNWASGMTLTWALLLTLFLPWLDAAKSYRPIVQQMQTALPHIQCTYIDRHHLAARIAWQQYGSLHISDNPNSDCPYQLVQYNPQVSPSSDFSSALWQGKRVRNKQEAFALIKRK